MMSGGSLVIPPSQFRRPSLRCRERILVQSGRLKAEMLNEDMSVSSPVYEKKDGETEKRGLIEDVR
jgi:hypothetical protein